MPLSIAIDVMGGDIGPSATVPAACNLANVYPDIEFLLYGEHALCQPFISSPLPLNIRFIATTDSVLMEDLPAHALRHKRHSSMGAALNAVALGQASGCVSAGNTGALLAMGIHFLGLFDGIDRPVLCQSLPVQGRTTPTYMLDLGANVDVEAKHLLQFACLGAALSSLLHDVPSPVVKLLNVGAESNKGSLCVKQAAEMMAVVSPLNYQGFVEGGDIYSGVADVIVCDGFAGNIALKVSEGVARLVMKEFALLLQSSILGRTLPFLIKPLFKRWQRKMDPGHYNGAYFIGLKGAVVKSHGGVGEKEFTSALSMLIDQVKRQRLSPLEKKLAVFLPDTK